MMKLMTFIFSYVAGYLRLLTLGGVRSIAAENMMLRLKTHWVMVVMDQFTPRIVGFAAHAGDMNGIDLCCKKNKKVQ